MISSVGNADTFDGCYGKILDINYYGFCVGSIDEADDEDRWHLIFLGSDSIVSIFGDISDSSSTLHRLPETDGESSKSTYNYDYCF